MPREIKSLPQMNADSLQYLANHTDVTYLSEGGIARAMVEATNLEISRVAEFVSAAHANSFLNSASGFYLDMFGEMLGVRRLNAGAASASAEDQNVQFSATVGILGDYFPDPGNLNQGKIPAGLSVTTEDGSITYRVAEDVYFSRGLKQVFVPVLADKVGSEYSVGRGKLKTHTGPSGVSVTNLKAIVNGSGAESDAQYRFRLANSVAARPTGNEIAVRLAAIGSSDVANVILTEFARGAGTFDALLVPVGNTVSFRTAELVRRSIESVAAFGISARVREPDYVKFKVSVQLIPEVGSGAGATDANKIKAKTAILGHFESIRLGGELIINRLRADIINSVSRDIKDIKLLELCINGKPHIIRNFKLKQTELFTPDNDKEFEAIQVL